MFAAKKQKIATNSKSDTIINAGDNPKAYIADTAIVYYGDAH